MRKSFLRGVRNHLHGRASSEIKFFPQPSDAVQNSQEPRNTLGCHQHETKQRGGDGVVETSRRRAESQDMTNKVDAQKSIIDPISKSARAQ